MSLTGSEMLSTTNSGSVGNYLSTYGGDGSTGISEPVLEAVVQQMFPVPSIENPVMWLIPHDWILYGLLFRPRCQAPGSCT